MEKRLNKFDFEKLLAFATVALLCVSMWGCSDDVTFKWEDSRRNAKVIGFVDDSLVMVSDYRFWLETRESWNGEYYDNEDAGNPRLCVYNYRVQEDGPRWCDSVSELHSSSWFYGQLTDSVVWGSGLPNSIKLWKIWEKPHEINLSVQFDGCSKKIDARRIHEWLDGKFIVLGSASVNGKTLESAFFAPDYGDEYCQYAVMDTVAKTVVYKHLESDFEWIKQCEDVRAWDKDVFCLILDKKTGNGFVFKNGIDSIFAPMEKIYEGHFSGNMIELGVRICSLKNDKITCSDVKWTGNEELKFSRNDGNLIYLK